MAALSVFCAAAAAGTAAGALLRFFACRVVSEESGKALLMRRQTLILSVLLTGALSGVVALRWPAYPYCALALSSLWLAEFHSLTDAAEGYIYDRVVLVSFLAAFALRAFWGGRMMLFQIIAGSAAGWAPLALIILITRGGMGWGDANMMAGLGALLGWEMTLLALYGGFIAGGIAALILLLAGRAGRSDALPMAPFLTLGIVFALLFGQRIFVLLEGSTLCF